MIKGEFEKREKVEGGEQGVAEDVRRKAGIGLEEKRKVMEEMEEAGEAGSVAVENEMEKYATEKSKMVNLKGRKKEVKKRLDRDAVGRGGERKKNRVRSRQDGG